MIWRLSPMPATQRTYTRVDGAPPATPAFSRVPRPPPSGPLSLSPLHTPCCCSCAHTPLPPQTQLATTSKELETRLSESKQFVQLKGLMQKKNAQLADLKARLGKYEPDVGGED